MTCGKKTLTSERMYETQHIYIHCTIHAENCLPVASYNYGIPVNELTLLAHSHINTSQTTRQVST